MTIFAVRLAKYDYKLGIMGYIGGVEIFTNLNKARSFAHKWAEEQTRFQKVGQYAKAEISKMNDNGDGRFEFWGAVE